MEMTNSEQTSELLQAHAHIWNHILNFIISMSLNCAIKLGIPDAINNHGRPMTLLELIDALPINKKKSDGIHRLMRMLVHSGYFVEKETPKNGQELGYWLTPASRLFLKDEPLCVTPFLRMIMDPVIKKPCHYMSEWFQNEALTPFEMAHGMTMWEYAGHESKFNNLFNVAMASDARLIASVVVNHCGAVFEGLESIVDVGGGTGTVAKVVAKAFPELKCTVLDLPQVVGDLVGSENLKFVGGDMFKAIPPANAVLLKWILHDWNDEVCVKILKQSKEAIPRKEEGGKVIIIDMVVNDGNNQKKDDNSIETQLFFDMLMMVLLTGKERTEKEWAKLFKAAGFNGGFKITPILGLRSVIEVFP
ncbi:hypothetical protein LguiA_022477 [Lonicera macranthoides]